MSDKIKLKDLNFQSNLFYEKIICKTVVNIFLSQIVLIKNSIPRFQYMCIIIHLVR